MKTKLFLVAAITATLVGNLQKANAQANQALSNLTSPTSINQSLLPQTDSAFDLGSSAKSWRNIYFKGIIYKGANKFISSPNVSSTFIGTKSGNSITTGFANTGVGDSALSLNTTGLYNTATGYIALTFNKTGYYNTANGSYALSGNTSGGYNTAIGSSALAHNSSGNFNTASGVDALYDNTIGQSNTASGYLSLEQNTAGSFNTAYGNKALDSNTTGYENTAVGSSALFSNSTGHWNVANGDSALYLNTTGIANTATGDRSLRSNTTGYNNTADGRTSLQVNTTGFENTATGEGALNANTTGNNNTAVGLNGLYHNITGSNNTTLGFHADVTSGNLTNATAIGANATVSQSNSLVLGGTGLNSVNVGIGTTSPLQKLHIVGASILANNTAIDPDAVSNSVIAGAIQDGSGWAVTSGIGGKASGTGDTWGIGAIGNSLYFGFGNDTANNKMQTGIQIMSNRNVLLVPGGSGNVGIGANSPAYKLDVCGTIRAKEILVQTGWCDYVFNKDYKLRSLTEVASYISQNKHLPDVPSATQVESNGVQVAQMDSILIKKVEELTLYIIDQNKQIQQLQQKVVQLENVDADKKN